MICAIDLLSTVGHDFLKRDPSSFFFSFCASCMINAIFVFSVVFLFGGRENKVNRGLTTNPRCVFFWIFVRRLVHWKFYQSVVDRSLNFCCMGKSEFRSRSRMCLRYWPKEL